MTMRVWALKIGELKPLSRAGLILLSARCALRVAPWVPPRAGDLWRRGLEYSVTNAFCEAALPNRATPLARELSDQGAMASNRLSMTDQPRGRCMNYAAQTLAVAVMSTNMALGPALKKTVIDCAKLSASIAGVLAHAGRVAVPAGNDPVEVACLAMWDAMRADIPALAAADADIESAGDRVQALRECASLWVGGVPDWASHR